MIAELGRKRTCLALALFAAIGFLLPACGVRYQNIKPRVMKPASQIADSQTQDGVSVAAEGYAYSGQGINYIKAGIHPIKVVVTNSSSTPMLVNPEQVLAYGSDGQMYLTYQVQEATALVINSHELEAVAQGAAGGALAGAALGALVGLAVGAIFNVNKGNTALAGALGGGLGGAAGGMKGMLAKLRNGAQFEISSNALRQSVVAPGFTVSGWLYFPGQYGYRELRIAISEVGTGKILPFKVPIPVPTTPPPVVEQAHELGSGRTTGYVTPGGN